MAASAAQGIARERNKKRESPTSKGTKERTLGRMNSGDKVSILDRGRKGDSGMIKTIITDHFKMLVRDMND